MEPREVEIRSEDVQEVMGQIPSWIVRRGITLLFAVVLVLVIGSCFFRYPDVIVTEMTLTGQQPVSPIVARSSGKITQFSVTDGERVERGQLLAIIENSATNEAVFRLKEIVNDNLYSPDSILFLNSFRQMEKLGDIQPSYITFLNSIHEYRNYMELDYYPQKRKFTQGQISKYRDYHQNMLRQYKVAQSQHGIACQQYSRDSVLFVRKVLSPAEFETSQATWLQSRYALEGASATLENLAIQIGQYEETLLDLELQQREKESQLKQSYRTAVEQLVNAISSWELSYCLISPARGVVTSTAYWNENQHVNTGDVVFSVVPDGGETLIGKALLPIERSGKVKAGQRVIVRFNNFPDQEFGIVNGELASISLVPNENNYMAEIRFPNGLETNYGLLLPLSHEMKASAEIVTEELRLIERFFMPIKKELKEGFTR
ncbi:MAG: HlyD family efflux transporter periplasmic adaptor subunit [Tannerellaceae bacterium]|jgi:HlyD family secretion protein|nr:HlyD family efflux transporter periplasmic adaptor subunit [Tannerellaceae bacterium]